MGGHYRLTSSIELYKKNLQALQVHYPELAELVQNAAANYRYESFIIGKNRLPNLKGKNSDWLYYDRDEPLKDVENQVKALKLRNARMVLFLGLGLGYELIYYIQSEAKAQRTEFILVVEKELEIFIEAIKCINLVDVIANPNIKLLIGEDENKLFPRFKNYLLAENRYKLIKAVKPVYHISALKLNKEYYMRVLQIFRDASTQAIIHFGNDPHDSLIGIEYMLDNIKEIVNNPGVNLLCDKFKNKPGIVVSTGPSLNKNKHLLQGLEDKALIISTDSSLRILIEMGVKPHMVTSLERDLYTAELLKDFSREELEDVYLTACPVIPKETYAAYNGPRIIVFRDYDHFRWLEIDRGILNIKMSAGNMAFKVAEALGCNPIVLIGQDLAFGDEGHTHAAGRVGAMDGVDKDIARAGGKIIEVMGNDGMPIKTNEGWYWFLKAYEVDVDAYPGTCINSTEGGAYIAGTKVMPFQGAIDKYIKDNIYPVAIINEGLKAFSPQEAEKDLHKMDEIMAVTIQDMQEIVSYCQEGIDICARYKQLLLNALYNPKELSDLKKNLVAIEAEIYGPRTKCSAIHRTFQLFLTHVIQSFAIKFEMDIIAIPEKYEDEDQARVEILLRQVEWYEVVGDLSRICLTSLFKAELQLEELIRS